MLFKNIFHQQKVLDSRVFIYIYIYIFLFWKKKRMFLSICLFFLYVIKTIRSVFGCFLWMNCWFFLFTVLKQKNFFLFKSVYLFFTVIIYNIYQIKRYFISNKLETFFFFLNFFVNIFFSFRYFVNITLLFSNLYYKNE